MFRVLIADDNYEDRDLLKLEITHALKDIDPDVRFFEAPSVKKASRMLETDKYDLMTLDIEFDRLNEGIDALPDFFDSYPHLNIIIVSGKLNKSEVTAELFKFTKDNVLKGKRWSRHFDVLDKKDNKADAIKRAHEFVTTQMDSADKVKDMLSLAESYLEQGEQDKCLDTYKKIQDLYPDEPESKENIKIFQKGGYEQALFYFRKGEDLVGGLLLGHHIENRLKAFTRGQLNKKAPPSLFDCLKNLDRARKLGQFKKPLFQNLLRLRNKCVHHPDKLSEQEVENAIRDIKNLESDF